MKANGQQEIKLNIGSGKQALEGYVSIDAHFGNIAFPLAYGDETVAECRASHILEHFPQGQTLDVLKDWARVLKPGGWLKIAVPDFTYIAKEYVEGNVDGLPLFGYLMGGQLDENDYHKAAFNEATLRYLLVEAGLTDIQPWTSEIKDAAALPVSLNLMGKKPNVVDLIGVELSGPITMSDSDHLGMYTMEGKPKTSRFDAFVHSIEPKNTYSQFGEDAIIEAIFERIGTANRWCVECGAGDGLFFSNTRKLIEQGWESVQIEADEKFYERLEARYRDNRSVATAPVRVGLQDGSRLDDVLLGVPTDFDLLVLDVDGQEYHIINSMMKFKPRVLIIEFDPDVEEMYIPEPGARYLDQAGMLATIYAVQARGYEVVCQTTCNLICVRKELAGLLLEQATVEQKPAAVIPSNEKHFVAGEWREEAGLIKDKATVKCGVVMSTPRHGSLDSAECIFDIAAGLGAPRFKTTGCWRYQGRQRSVEAAQGFGSEGKREWEEELTEALEEAVESGIDIIVTADYDTFATQAEAKELIKLLYQNPQYDCIVPLQIRRGTFEEILATFAGQPDMSQALVPILTGHFGLTVFRRSVFEKLSRPWFLPIPDADGKWGPGRTDADIYFWNKFTQQGFKAALATQVVIGHGDEVVTWPKLENGKVVKVYQPLYAWHATRKQPS